MFCSCGMLQKELIYTSLAFGINFLNISYIIFHVDDYSNFSSEVCIIIGWCLTGAAFYFTAFTIATEMSKAVVFTEKDAKQLESVRFWCILVFTILNIAFQIGCHGIRHGWIIRGFFTLIGHLNLLACSMAMGVIEYKLHIICEFIGQAPSSRGRKKVDQTNPLVCTEKRLRTRVKYFRAVVFGMTLLAIYQTMQNGFEFKHWRLGPPCKPEMFE